MGDGVFGFDPEDFDRLIREAGDGLRDALTSRIGDFFDIPGEGAGWGAFFEGLAGRAGRARPEPATAGEAGDGVWAVYLVGDDGDARVEQVYPTEIDALRANRHNTDPRRRVRFLPYGIAVSVLDGAESDADDADD